MEAKILSIIEDLEATPTDQITFQEPSRGLTQENIRGIEHLDTLLKQFVPYISDAKPDLEHVLDDFRRLQDSFEYNLTSSLLNIYKLGARPGPGDEAHILLANRSLQGLLLIHPHSRKLFARRENMNLILSFLKKSTPSPGSTINSNYEPSIELKLSFVSTLIHILLKNLNNFRMFEKCSGCTLVIQYLDLFPTEQQISGVKENMDHSAAKINLTTNISFHTAKDTTIPISTVKSPSQKNQQDLNFKVIEFLLFYLVDENENSTEEADPTYKSTRDTASKLSIQEKANLFRDSFPEIDSLVENLNDLKNV